MYLIVVEIPVWPVQRGQGTLHEKPSQKLSRYHTGLTKSLLEPPEHRIRIILRDLRRVLNYSHIIAEKREPLERPMGKISQSVFSNWIFE